MDFKHKGRILIVDDSEAVRESVAATVRTLGEVGPITEVADGFAARETTAPDTRDGTGTAGSWTSWGAAVTARAAASASRSNCESSEPPSGMSRAERWIPSC